MIETVIQMSLIMLCGIAWHWIKPLAQHAEQVRLSITRLVYNLLLPALVLQVMWQSSIGLNSMRIAVTAAATVIICLVLGALVFRYLLNVDKPKSGALILACAFPNAIYLGLPVLEQTLGPWARAVAIQFDYFAATPLFFTAGVWVAMRFGNGQVAQPIGIKNLLKVPPLWAALAGALFNLLQWPIPDFVASLLSLLGRCVSPLMLIALGMALHWQALRRAPIVLLLPVFVIQLAIMPLIAMFIGNAVALPQDIYLAMILETAMPCMVIGLVLCDQYQLDTRLYAAAVTLSTLLAIGTLPAWYEYLA